VRPPKIPRVYANLNVLVQKHPGWKGVALYDAMLTRLQASIDRAQIGLHAPIPAVGLGQIQGVDLPNGAFALPQSTMQQQRLLLAQLAEQQIQRLQERRAQVRALEIRAQKRVWRRDARSQYEQSVAAINSRYQTEYLNAIAQDKVDRLNLMLQIQALQHNIAQWSLAQPPTPRLNQNREALAQKQSALAKLLADRTGQVAALQQTRDTALAQALAARTAFVENQQAALTDRLTKLDQDAVEAQRLLLARQTSKMLDREQQLIAAAVPVAGTLGSVAVAQETNPGVPLTGVRQTEARLILQRDRWIRNIYEDTQAAAEDAAQQRGWNVTFGTRQPGELNRTSDLAKILTGEIWKQ
jgi:hypothetical protein